MRQPIQRIGGQQQAIEQQCIGRYGRLAQACALQGDQQEHQLQRQAAQENVAVHGQQRSPGLPVLQCCPCDLPWVGAQRRAGQGQAEQGGTPLGNHRGPR